ncbi:hypothetical protein [Flavobacterium sp. 1]|uniref:hypothetical protein n=1 Tax=Flavobacterium sp. 1 TaxID=2035200 RepID=UPI001E540B64|nr:hypothetical protein [Flavobacterium sp. 1]
MDSQSVRWINNRSLKSFDGFLLAIMVTVVNIHDNKAVLLLMRTQNYFLCPVKVILADGG